MDVSDDYSLKDAIYPPAGNNSSSRRESGGGVTPLPGFDGRPKSAASEGPVEPPRTQSEIEVQDGCHRGAAAAAAAGWFWR